MSRIKLLRLLQVFVAGVLVLAIAACNTAPSQTTDGTPSSQPSFAPIASASTMERRVNSLRSAGVDVEFRVYRDVGHGFGLGIGTNAEGWLADAVQFWENHLSA